MGHRSGRGGRLRGLPGDDSGFSLIESVVALFILMIIATAVLPILLQGLVQSANNQTTVTAASLANQSIEDARAQKTCTGLTALDQTSTARPGVTLRTQRIVGACPSTFPSTVSVQVNVSRTDTGAVLVSASTLVFVTGS